MLIRQACLKLLVAVALASVALSTTSAFGQASATQQGISNNEVTTTQGPRSGGAKNGVAATPTPRPGDLESDVAAMKADNAAVREQFRKMEEQQKTLLEEQRALLELVQRLQRQLDGSTVAEASRTVQPLNPATTADGPAPSTAEAQLPLSIDGAPAPVASSPGQPSQEGSLKDRLGSRYDDGFILLHSSEDSKVPFLLKLNLVTQFRYLNTTAGSPTFTDHLGVSRPVDLRNDFSINRSMATFSGFVFDKRLQYNLIVWASNSTATTIVGANVGFRFSKKFTLWGGYWAVPGSRTLSYTFPYFTQPERSLADNFFRPGFTQGVWAIGEPLKGFNYHVFIGNALNTLAIPTAKIDTTLTYSGSVWWEPLGPYGPEGRSTNMYDDYYEHEKPALRIGTSYTRSREDRFSNIDTKNPENTAMHNSDGVLTFATGAFAPGVTVQEATYRMWAIDGGLKWRGLAVNGQYYFRWLNDFVADGPLPLASTFDNGGELSASYFVVPKKFMLYGRASAIYGQFADSYEYAPGFKWYPINDHRVWLVGELLRVHRSPYGSIITPYAAGLNGWAPVVQMSLNF
jgi:hypothetical protein